MQTSIDSFVVDSLYIYIYAIFLDLEVYIYLEAFTIYNQNFCFSFSEFSFIECPDGDFGFYFLLRIYIW
jgi:hypothetical protein